MFSIIINWVLQVDDWKRKVSGMYATANAKSQAQSDKFAANSFGEYSTDTHSGSTERNDDTVHVLSQEELLAKSLSYAQKCPIFNPPSLDKEDRITLQLLEKYSRMSSSNQVSPQLFYYIDMTQFCDFPLFGNSSS